MNAEDDKLRRRSQFRQLPVEKTYDFKAQFEKKEISRQRAVHESPEHRGTKELIAVELARWHAGRNRVVNMGDDSETTA